MDIVGTKVLVAILFGILRFLFAILPIFIFSWFKLSVEEVKKSVNEKKCSGQKHDLLICGIALLQSFGGGVLFATCMLHMTPEVYYSLQELQSYGILSSGYPYSQLAICIGFFAVYFIEEMCHWLVTKVPDAPCERRNRKTRASSKIQIISKDNKILPQENGTFAENENMSNTEIQYLPDDELKLNLENSPLEEPMESVQDYEKLIEKEVKTRQQIVRCMFFVLALSFHAIFEGVAIGLQHSIASIWFLFVAVSIHSITILFCMGLELVLARVKTRTIVIHMLILSAMSPIGVFAGLIVSLTTDLHTSAKSFGVLILEGLSTGTLMYITFFEVLNREKERRKFRFRRGAFILGGFVLMAVFECVKVYEKH